MTNQPDVKILFGSNVRKTRLEKDLSQEELANLSGIHRTYISEVERGLRNISIENMDLLARTLGVKLSKLLDF